MDLVTSFISEYFPRLPSHVILEVLSYLPASYLTEFMMKWNNEIIELILEEYFSKEMHLMLSPTYFPHRCKYPDHIKRLVDFESFGEIDEFLSEFPNVNPRRLVFITGGDFRSLEQLLLNYRERFIGKSCEIDLYIERYELDDKDLELITSFPNVRKLQFSRATMAKTVGALTNHLSKLLNLQELVFLGHKIMDWSYINFPLNLKHLDISWYEHLNVNTINVPDSVTDLFWNRSGLDSVKLYRKTFPANLKTLMLTYNNLTNIDVSKLPATLETIDLLYNSISSFTSNSSDKAWPANLKSILLSHNDMTDLCLELLSELAWPVNLKNLRLDNNRFTSLVNLKYLPDRLEYLDLSFTPLESLDISPTGSTLNGCTSFRFPEFLDTLYLSNCYHLDFFVYLATNRITFPSYMTCLNLDDCNIMDLQVFEFPKSIRKLSISGNKIEDLASYNLTIDEGNGPKDVVNWNQLVHLVDLELYLNKIQTLDAWEVPPSLRSLDLRLNFISFISTKSPLFSSHHTQSTKNLHVLKLSDNNIKTIASDISIPPNIKVLSLDRNHLVDEFVFPESFVSSHSLEELGLSMCGLRKLTFTSLPTRNHQLKKLDLTDNYLLYEASDIRQSINEFYDELEHGLGVKMSKRKFRVNSIHTFV